jgi:pimeloyl-ACP methyl ester carboxylesterase
METAPPQLPRDRLRRLGRFTLLSVLYVSLAVYVALCAFIYLYQDKLTFPAPTDYPKDTPASVGISFEDLHIPVGAEQIHAWWIPSAQPSTRVILYFHGNGYTIEGTARFEAFDLHSLGVNLLIVDYRGYGTSSPGNANGIRATQDARAALNYLIQIRHVPVGNIIIFGRSIGTGIASQLAFETPQAAGLILISPFTTLNDVARESWQMRILPLELMGSRNSFNNLSKIALIHMPLLLVVGDQDTLTPPKMAQALKRRANEPKQLVLVPSAGHNDIFEVGGLALVAQLESFIATLPSSPQR